MLDSRFIQTTQVLEIAKASYRLPLIAFATNPNPTKFVTLERLETYYGEFNGSFNPSTDTFGIPIEVPSDASLYHVRVKAYIDPSVAANFDFQLKPNYTSYTTGKQVAILNNVQLQAAPWSSVQSGVDRVGWIDCQAGGSDTAPYQNEYYCFTNPIDKKFMMGKSCDVNGVCISYMRWDDTTTPWTKLGSLWFTHLVEAGTATVITSSISLKLTCFVQRII